MGVDGQSCVIAVYATTGRFRKQDASAALCARHVDGGLPENIKLSTDKQ